MATVPASDRTTTVNLASASAGPFDLTFRLFDEDDVLVYIDGVQTNDFTLTTNFSGGYDDDATVTLDAAADSGSEIIIMSSLIPSRDEDYINGAALVANMNIELGRVWSKLSDLHRDTSRSARFFSSVSPGALTADAILVVSDDAGKVTSGPSMADLLETLEDAGSANADRAETAADESEAARDSAETILSEVSEIQIEINRIEAEANTLAAGASATVTYDPESSPIMSFGIPKGDKGIKGDKGNKGDPGSAFIWKAAVADETALLALPSPEEDEGRVTLDTGNLWLYQGGTWTDTGAPAVGPEGPPGTTDYEELTNVPETFPPAVHDHDTRYLKLTGGTVTNGIRVDATNQSYFGVKAPSGYARGVAINPDGDDPVPTLVVDTSGDLQLGNDSFPSQNMRGDWTVEGERIVRDRTEAAASAPAFIAPEWVGGRDIEFIYDPNDADVKPSIYIQREVNSGATTDNKGYPFGIMFSGRINGGGTAVGAGIRSVITNNGTSNDCVGVSARCHNNSDNGLTCGTFGGADVQNPDAGATMGLEGHIYVNQGTTSPRDASGFGWRAAIHAFSDGTGAPGHFGLLIGSRGMNSGKYGFWNGIGINGSAFAHDGDANAIAGTVGINMAWGAERAETAIKLGNVGSYHISRHNASVFVDAQHLIVENTSDRTEITLKPKSTSYARYNILVDGTERAAFAWDGTDVILRSDQGSDLIFKTDNTERLRFKDNGRINVSGLPTSSAGLASGDLWNDSGTVKVA